MATFLGTFGRDVFGPSSSGDIYWTFGGDDVISTGGGNDVVFAGFGKDVITVGDGNNVVRGGWNADTFAFESGASGTTRIRDFQSGLDKIDLSALGITDFDEIVITTPSTGPGTFLTVANQTIEIGLDPSEIVETDFIFAAPVGALHSDAPESAAPEAGIPGLEIALPLDDVLIFG